MIAAEHNGPDFPIPHHGIKPASDLPPTFGILSYSEWRTTSQRMDKAPDIFLKDSPIEKQERWLSWVKDNVDFPVKSVRVN